MIARPITRPRPIPFGATTVQVLSSHAGATTSASHAVTASRAVSRPRAHGASPSRGTGSQRAPLLAKYLGHGALSVLSSSTGLQYRFVGHGHLLDIDPRDELMLRRLPDLWVA